MTRTSTGIIASLLDLVYPPRCQVCLAFRDDGPLCAECRRAVQDVPDCLCQACGFPLHGQIDLCPDCQEHAAPFAWSVAAGLYDARLRAAIHKLKYGGRTALARPLGDLLSEALLSCLAPGAPMASAHIDLVIAVPLHASRLRSRGFNQAELVAGALCARTGFTQASRCLRRARRTVSQTALTPEGRMRNVHGAFQVARPDEVRGRSVLIVDDVLTTGATGRECARILREAGANRVYLAGVARSVERRDRENSAA